MPPVAGRQGSSDLSARRAISRRSLLIRGVAVAGAASVVQPGWALGRRRTLASAEIAIVGGRVLSMDKAVGDASAVAIAGGRVIAVGSDADVRALVGPQTEVIDARGATVMPGVHDGHSHPFSGGRLLTQPNLDYALLDLEQFVNRIRKLLASSADREPDGWLEVELWDATAMDKLPTKKDLDALPTRRPILVYSIDGHIALANSRALEIAGIDASTPDPPGGEIRRGPGREPNGILLDNAVGLVAAQIPPPTAEQNADALAASYDLMAQAGITTCLHASTSEAELAALAALADRGPLAVRPHVALTVEAEESEDPAAMLARVEGLRNSYARPGIAIDNLKLFFDGVIEYPTQTAALLKPYRVDKGTKEDPRWVRGKDRGPTYWRPKIAEAAVAAADAAGWQVHVHAIGDRAARSALDAFEAALAVNGRRDNRHTICHLELVDPKDFPRFGKLGVLASMQMQWAERDSYTVERLRDYLGAQALAQHLPRRLPAQGRGAALRRQRLAGGPTAALPPDRDGRQSHRRRGLCRRPEAALPRPGHSPAPVAGHAYPQQRLPAAPGVVQRPPRARPRRRPRDLRPGPARRAAEEGLEGEG